MKLLKATRQISCKSAQLYYQVNYLWKNNVFCLDQVGGFSALSTSCLVNSITGWLHWLPVYCVTELLRLTHSWWLLPALSVWMEFDFDEYDDRFFFIPAKEWENGREKEREGGREGKRECAERKTALHLLCLFSLCLWHILHRLTLKLEWNAGMMSIWLSVGCFQVYFCRDLHSYCGKIGGTESLDEVALQPRFTQV